MMKECWVCGGKMGKKAGKNGTFWVCDDCKHSEKISDNTQQPIDRDREKD